MLSFLGLTKGGEELVFTIGGVNLEHPMNRRYFYCEDEAGKMRGFVVFLPYDQGRGYLADVTRRRNDAPQGVLEKLIYKGFMTFKEEGALDGNMGFRLCTKRHLAKDSQGRSSADSQPTSDSIDRRIFREVTCI